ncbi:uncharacterized protein LOC120169447 [Hibiscus syriacus]|uniref:uncharacterized protein LOC120169447 n=1 Tax=Hibiscus syriacus TaxID=106335 RepID=UPI00192349DA|nr:uncharacterized protein LOC120169447 [Hibiscus syriacus]
MDWCKLFGGSTDQNLDYFPPNLRDGIPTVCLPSEILEEGQFRWEQYLCFFPLAVNQLEIGIGLSYIASAIGVPISMDTITAKKSILEFAKVCIEIGVKDDIPKLIEVVLKDRQTTLINVEVPWLPHYCRRCNVFGRNEKGCVLKTTSNQIVPQVWKKKTTATTHVGGIEVLQEPEKFACHFTAAAEVNLQIINDSIDAAKKDIVVGSEVNARCKEVAIEVNVPDQIEELNFANDVAAKNSTEDDAAVSSSVNVPTSDHVIHEPTEANEVRNVQSSVIKRGRGRPLKENAKTQFSGSSIRFELLNYAEEIPNSIESFQRKPRAASLGNNVDVLCLLETRVKVDKADAIVASKFQNWNFCFNYDHASNGIIWVLWRKGINLSVIQNSAQCITVRGSHRGTPMIISAIYGSNDGTARRQLWQTLREVDLTVNKSPWVLGGDFNIIMHSHESTDHEVLGHYLTSDMKDFQDLAHELELHGHHYFGPSYTWTNKQKDFFLARKLDRVMINSYWATIFQHSFVEFIAPGVSDHCMSLTWLFKEISANKPKPFKFFNFWVAHPSFINVVSQSWLQPTHGNPMQILFTKLKRLKEYLTRFNKENYSMLSDRVKLKRIELENQQLLTLKGHETIENELLLQEELYTLETAKVVFLKQKAKVQWIKDRDKNSKFFHSTIAFKNTRDIIRVLVDDQGYRLESFEAMSKEIVSIYSNLIGTADNMVKDIDPILLKDLLNYSLPYEASSSLVKEITREEIQKVVFCQGKDKALGPDSFTPLFFKNSWNIVSEDVVAAVKFFFHSATIHHAFNSTIIALVPKIPNPSAVKDYRPISCCSVIYKIITKIIVRRLTDFLPDIITLNQTAFIKGMIIIDNSLLAQEMVKGYGRKSISPSLPIRYLGIPLVTRKLTEKDCQALIDKIKLKLHHWSSKNLSYACHLELIRSVLFNVINYWCKQLVLPTSILKKVEQLCSRYFWKGTDKSAAGAHMSWDNICVSKSEGGLGLNNIKTWNKACLITLIRKILAGNGSLWVAWLKAYVFKEQDFWHYKAAINLSWSTNRILKLRAEAFPIFSAGSPQVKEIWDLIRSKGQIFTWHKLIWFPMNIPKISLIAWMALLNKLPTRDRLLKMGISTDSICVNCSNSYESRDYLFSQCTMAVELWNSILTLNRMKTTFLSWNEMVINASSLWKGSSFLSLSFSNGFHGKQMAARRTSSSNNFTDDLIEEVHRKIAGERRRDEWFRHKQKTEK